MIEAVFSAILENPERIITICSLAVALFFGYRLFNSFEKKVDEAEESTAKWSGEVQEELKTTRAIVKQHSEDLGKATKAIGGDFLKMKESIIDLRTDLARESEQLRKHVYELKSELSLTIQKSNFITESVTEKTGKIIMVEQAMAKVTADSKHQAEIINKIVKAVNSNIKDITDLKSRT